MVECISLKGFTVRVQKLMGIKRKAAHRRSLRISAPFNFVHESSALPGISEDEISILKEKAAASRIGVAPGSPEPTAKLRRAPAPPSSSSPLRSHAPMVMVGRPVQKPLGSMF
ncbi:uncharacterized protein B0I36DRAFT_318518 [Microdochium trichocladiopsis]|uniref:Uncharacterized protein n=1 Tax=Microdochium trichocladiopsis TaxID=1682393 RepID=A0A9P8YCP1_9PEZI|nr:uncharacterized protein B0I36DRAFT_318518 [Microdochium trichocladiopsis]KAH7035515.1 hypothetical protein B0I36DRAFT_318518 [Microdochium trichocladiopsis]